MFKPEKSQTSVYLIIDFDKTLTPFHTAATLDQLPYTPDSMRNVINHIKTYKLNFLNISWYSIISAALRAQHKVCIATFNRHISFIQMYLEEIIQLSPQEIAQISIKAPQSDEIYPENKNAYIVELTAGLYDPSAIIFIDDHEAHLLAAQSIGVPKDNCILVRAGELGFISEIHARYQALTGQPIGQSSAMDLDL